MQQLKIEKNDLAMRVSASRPLSNFKVKLLYLNPIKKAERKTRTAFKKMKKKTVSKKAWNLQGRSSKKPPVAGWALKKTPPGKQE